MKLFHIAYYCGTRSDFRSALYSCSILWKRGKVTAMVFGRACLLPSRNVVQRVMWMDAEVSDGN